LRLYEKVYFGKRLIKKHKLPKFLLKGNQENYSDYMKRIDKFLSSYSQKQLSELMGWIDPNEEVYKPTVEYLMKKVNSKSKSCNLI